MKRLPGHEAPREPVRRRIEREAEQAEDDKGGEGERRLAAGQRLGHQKAEPGAGADPFADHRADRRHRSSDAGAGCEGGQGGWQADPASRIGQGAAGFWSLAPSVDLPLFDAGRREANLEAARARIDGSAAEWTKAVLGAFREVEDALADLRELAQQEELTARVLAAVRERLANAEARLRAGLANESELTVARRDEALAARTLSLVVWERRQVAVRLAAATGGGWSSK